MSLPITFGLMMSAAVLLGIYASWQSLRAAFRAGHIRDLPSIDASEARRTLQDEKEAVLGNIRDLRFEHEAGKLAEDDFERQDTHLRARAREVLRLLDEDLDEYVRRAEKAILKSLGPDARSPYRASADADSTDADSDDAFPPKSESAAAGSSCPSCDVSNDADAEFCKKCGTRLAAVSCGSCSTENDCDAEFCKKCGGKLHADAKDDSANTEAAADEASAADEAVDEAAADGQSADKAAADDEDDSADKAAADDEDDSADKAAADDEDDSAQSADDAPEPDEERS